MKPAWKNRNSNAIIVYTSKQKNYQFSFKKPSATKYSPSSYVYLWNFIAFFKI